MADITICTNDKCPHYTYCGRAKVEPHPYWQSYCSFIPDEDGNCDMFWEE